MADGGEGLPEDRRTKSREGASECFCRGGREESPSCDGADGGLKKHCCLFAVCSEWVDGWRC